MHRLTVAAFRIHQKLTTTGDKTLCSNTDTKDFTVAVLQKTAKCPSRKTDLFGAFRHFCSTFVQCFSLILLQICVIFALGGNDPGWRIGVFSNSGQLGMQSKRCIFAHLCRSMTTLSKTDTIWRGEDIRKNLDFEVAELASITILYLASGFCLICATSLAILSTRDHFLEIR